MRSFLVLIALLWPDQPAWAQASANASSAATSDYRFHAETGLLVFHVRPEATDDFEQVVERLRQGLETTVSQVRRDQASGWRFFRATATADAAVYVMLFDPVIRDADYDPVKMLVELAPGEAQPLYERLRGSVIRVERLDLNRVR
jgi:hypothetical protein